MISFMDSLNVFINLIKFFLITSPKSNQVKNSYEASKIKFQKGHIISFVQSLINFFSDWHNFRLKSTVKPFDFNSSCLFIWSLLSGINRTIRITRSILLEQIVENLTSTSLKLFQQVRPFYKVAINSF